MITLEKNDDYYKLTFSQRVGETSLPEPMRLKQIPQKFRQELWLSIETEISNSSDIYGWNDLSIERNIGSIIESYEYDVLGHFHDEIENYSPVGTQSYFKELIRDGIYHEVLTLLEYMLRHEYCADELRNNLIEIFNKTPIAYFVEKIGGLPTIVPRISLESGEVTQQAINVIQHAGIGGASRHLRQAAEHINAEQYHDSISDSISAVESVARQISPESKTLGQALKVLRKKEVITNQQLKDGFEKLYSYTNSEKGIRHALMDDDSSKVGLDEAMFMFGACASFAAYLVNKHQQLKQQEDAA